jgi:hypothetical protein
MNQSISLSAPATNTQGFEKKTFNTQEKPKDIRRSNIIAAKCILLFI